MGRRAAGSRAGAAGRRPKLGDVAVRLRGSAAGVGAATGESPVAVRRELLAAWCKMALPGGGGGGGGGGNGRGAPGEAGAAGAGAAVAPRVRETLRHLLGGDSEKQIALKLGISPHTVHVYVKRLYRHYGVSSRGELLARFVSAGAAGASPD